MNGLTDTENRNPPPSPKGEAPLRKVFDSNFVINSFHRLQAALADTFKAEFARTECFISVITEMELLSFHAISPAEEAAGRKCPAVSPAV
jgi:hypothetical protein